MTEDEREEWPTHSRWAERLWALIGGIVGGVGFMCGFLLRWKYRDRKFEEKR